MKPVTSIELFILAALLRCPAHPYAIRQEVIELSNRQLWPPHSTVRNALNRLLNRKLIEDWAEDPYYYLKARRGDVYSLTEAGRKTLERQLLMYADVIKTARNWAILEHAREVETRLREINRHDLHLDLSLD